MYVHVCNNTGFHNEERVQSFLEEALQMKNLSHPNILNLIGVCMDGGPAPYIVMPYMANGSLLVHLRENKGQLVLEDNSEHELVSVLINTKQGQKD